MIVVADTSPINYLVQVHLDSLLPQLYQRLLIPSAVLTELQHQGSPRMIRDWANQPPVWCKVQQPTLSLSAELAGLDAGECAAIELAFELRASKLLLDERKARHIAVHRFGLPLQERWECFAMPTWQVWWMAMQLTNLSAR